MSARADAAEIERLKLELALCKKENQEYRKRTADLERSQLVKRHRHNTVFDAPTLFKHAFVLQKDEISHILCSDSYKMGDVKVYVVLHWSEKGHFFYPVCQLTTGGIRSVVVECVSIVDEGDDNQRHFGKSTDTLIVGSSSAVRGSVTRCRLQKRQCGAGDAMRRFHDCTAAWEDASSDSPIDNDNKKCIYTIANSYDCGNDSDSHDEDSEEAVEKDFCCTIEVSLVSTPFNVADDAPEEDNVVVVEVEGEDFRVNSAMLKQWSGFFRGYFESNMKEAQEGRFPIKDVSINDFKELLLVISPIRKSIDQDNVERLLALADRFVMPELTHHCELFLCNFSSTLMTMAELFILAEQYKLGLVLSRLLDRWSDLALLRKELLNSPEYDGLSPEARLVLGARLMDAAKEKVKITV